MVNHEQLLIEEWCQVETKAAEARFYQRWPILAKEHNIEPSETEARYWEGQIDSLRRIFYLLGYQNTVINRWERDHVEIKRHKVQRHLESDLKKLWAKNEKKGIKPEGKFELAESPSWDRLAIPRFVAESTPDQ